MNRIAIILVLASAILGCAGPAVKPERVGNNACRSFNIDYSAVALPDRFGAIHMVERTVYPRQEAGLLARYSRPGDGTSWIDVFVYPICLPKFCSLAQVIELEMANVLKGVQTVNPGSAVQELVSFMGERNGKRYEALKAKVEIVKDRRWLSFAYLAAMDDLYVKIRFTQPEGKDYESQVDSLAASLLTELRFTDPEAHRHEMAPTLLVNRGEAEHGNIRLLGAQLSYAAFMSMEIEKGRYLDTFERSLSCWEPTLKVLEKMQSDGLPDPGDACFTGMIAARNAGYLKDYLWTYFRRPYWIGPPDLKLDGFKVWASHNLKGHTPCDPNRVLVGWK